MKLPTVSPSLSRRVRALLTCGILLSTATIGTTALWATTAATTSGVFTTASIKLAVDDRTVQYDFDFPDPLLPGERTAKVVKVQNIGSVAFKYSVGVASDNPVGRSMILRAVATPTMSSRTCSGGSVIVNNQVITSSINTFTSNRGDLAAGSGEEFLCFELSLPLSASSSLLEPPNNGEGSVTFSFAATTPS